MTLSMWDILLLCMPARPCLVNLVVAVCVEEERVHVLLRVLALLAEAQRRGVATQVNVESKT